MGLNQGDLRSLVYDIFEIDSFKSKMGDDKNIVVLSFSARTRESARDLENFIERGYNEVLDADSISASNSQGNYKVFAEFPRTRQSVAEIDNLIKELKLLTLKETFQFKFYKDSQRYDYDVNTLQNVMAVSPLQYTNEVV